MKASVTLSKEDAQAIIDKHHPNKMIVVAIDQIQNNGFSYTKSSKTYIVDLAESEGSAATHSSFISVFSSVDVGSTYHPNPLDVSSRLISLISKSSIIPISTPHVDDSLTTVPFPYLMTAVDAITSSTIVSLADVRKMGVLTPQQTVLIDLYLGKFLGQLHSGVMNEWYGLPLMKEPADPSYSWQETFTSLFDSVLAEAEARGYEFAYPDIRGALSRAIAFFLFDDVEVPSLVWFTGSEEDIYVKLHPQPVIAAFPPQVGHAVWGDPLLEALFVDEPSEAMLEGYRMGGGEELIVFARQKTKRLWYTMFLALVVLSERERGEEKEVWAVETVRRVSEELRTAPCYG